MPGWKAGQFITSSHAGGINERYCRDGQEEAEAVAMIVFQGAFTGRGGAAHWHISYLWPPRYLLRSYHIITLSPHAILCRDPSSIIHERQRLPHFRLHLIFEVMMPHGDGRMAPQDDYGRCREMRSDEVYCGHARSCLWEQATINAIITEQLSIWGQENDTSK